MQVLDIFCPELHILSRIKTIWRVMVKSIVNITSLALVCCFFVFFSPDMVKQYFRLFLLLYENKKNSEVGMFLLKGQ